MTHAYRFGIEEELFLADATTRGTPGPAAERFHAAAKARLDAVSRELLASQVEICTPPSTSVAEAAERLHALRSGLAGIGEETGLKVFAAGTHPTARWTREAGTQAERYEGILDELRMVGERAVICGMHVHVEVARPEARLDLMTRLLPFLPVLLALSTASPFWQGRDTGLAGYRLRAFGEMPRTGLPPLFASEAEHARYVRVLTEAGAIADASYLWWHLRPSLKYPTLELRVADSCTRLSDTLAIAALYRCLVRLVERRPDINAGLTSVSHGLIQENLWRAERHGVRAGLIDEAREAAVPLAEVVETLLDLTAEDAAALGCETARDAVRGIVAQGTSADRQTACHAAALAAGASEEAALHAVVDWLARTTAEPARLGTGSA